jgi:hypothetical protein
MSKRPNLGQVSSSAREKIFEAKTAGHFENTRELFEDYARYLDFDLDFQDFASELLTFPETTPLPTAVFFLRQMKSKSSAASPYANGTRPSVR